MAEKKQARKIGVATPGSETLTRLKAKLLISGSDELTTILTELTEAGWEPSPDEARDTVGRAVSGIIDRELDGCMSWRSFQWPKYISRKEKQFEAEDFIHHLAAVAFDSSLVSRTFLLQLMQRGGSFRSEKGHNFPFFLKAWALFVTRDETLDWLWFAASVTSQGEYRASSYRDGKQLPKLKGEVIADTVSEFTRILDEALAHRNRSLLSQFLGTSNQPWRDQALKIMELLLRMFAARSGYGWRDESSVDLRLAQEALREQLDGHPHWIPIFVRFYLDQLGEDQRCLVEGMLDRVEAADEVIEALESYQGSPDVEFHAQALASDLRGELPAARHAHTPRTRLEPEPVLKPGVQNWGIWLEYPEAHELIVLAAEQAMSEHRADLDEYLGQDEHELCALFIKSLCDRLRDTQGQLYEMFRGKREALRLNAEIKRFPRTARNGLPSEGGSNPWYADLGILVHAKFPGVIELHRGTLFQAKKLEHKAKGNVWKPDLQIDKTQMKNLLAKSRESQYLFFLPSTISARSPLVLRAQLLQDMLKAQKKLQRSVLKRAGKSFVESFAYDLVGGWCGDDGPELIADLQAGEEMSQGPRLILDVTIEVGENG